LGFLGWFKERFDGRIFGVRFRFGGPDGKVDVKPFLGQISNGSRCQQDTQENGGIE
jgi:hypothetical protein